MAFSKYANAAVVQPVVTMAAWDDLRAKALAIGGVFDKKANAEVVQKYDPKEYMLSHCTIIASVDTENGPGSLGRTFDNGFQIDRRFKDYYITPNTAKYVNNNCFVPGTLILMGDGTERSIEDVVVGDTVVTHTGKIRKVLETFKHPFRGYLRDIKRLGDNRKLSLTPEHPVWAMTSAITCACGCGTPLDRKGRKAAVHRFQDYVQGHGAKPRKNPKPDYTWISAALLEKGDFLSSPRLQGVSDTAVTPGKARLLGYYLAEGFYHKQKSVRVSVKYKQAIEGPDSIPVGVNFALCLDETDTLVAEIQRLLKEEFNVGSSVSRVSENGVCVYSQQSMELVQFIKEHATEYAKKKRLHASVLTWPLHLQREVAQAWIEGDGCVESTAGGWISVTSASSDLISQMHLIFGRLGVFATRGERRAQGRKRSRVANGSYVVVADPTKECVSYTLQVGSVHAEALLGGSFLEGLYRRSVQNRRKHTLGFRVSPERTMFPIRSVEKRYYDGSVYNFETDEDHSYVANGVAVHNSDSWERKLLLGTFRTFIGGQNYVEHLQIPELSKGRIIDAAARDLGDTVYVDILVATELKHRPLIAAIQSKELQTLSMGCSVQHTTCTQCGNVAEDETQLCAHIKYSKGNSFMDSLGKVRKAVELCGHHSDLRSVKFIEASWVANPAFTGAVLRNILTPEEAAMAGHRMQFAFSMPTQVPDASQFGKAARIDNTRREQIARSGYVNHGARVVNHVNNPAIFPRIAVSDPSQGGPSEEQFEGADAATPKKEEGQPIDKAVDNLADLIKEKALEKVRGEMNKKDLPPRADLDENQNNTLLREAVSKSASWRRLAEVVIASTPDSEAARKVLIGLMLFKNGGWKAVKKASYSGIEVLAISRFLDKIQGVKIAGEHRIYRTVLAVGGMSAYGDVDSYLAACRRVVGRELTTSEVDTLVAKGKLFDL